MHRKKSFFTNSYHVSFPGARKKEFAFKNSFPESTLSLFFTSRPGNPDPDKGNPNAVYLLDLAAKQPAGRILQRVLQWKSVQMPNGIVSSPDDKELYLIEAHPDEGHNRLIYAYHLDAVDCWKAPRTLIDFSPGRSGDGMCIDAQGNLYVAAGLHKTRKTSFKIKMALVSIANLLWGLLWFATASW